MKTRDVVREARNLFAQEPSVVRVEADLQRRFAGELAVDFTVIVEGDLGEGEKRVVPILIEFMRRFPTMPVEFGVLPVSAQVEPRGLLVFSRDSQRETVEPR